MSNGISYSQIHIDFTFFSSGINHGNCSCSKCICDPAYSGDACDCLISTDNCRSDNGVR